MLELTIVHKTSGFMPTSLVPFTKPFTVNEKPFTVLKKQAPGSRMHRSYIKGGIAKIGEKLAWIKYDYDLYDRLRRSSIPCYIAENDDEKYLMLVLPAECERKVDFNEADNKSVLGGVYAPDSVIAELQSRIGDLPVFFASKAADYVRDGERRRLRIRSYFQIFDDIEVVEPVAAK